MKRLLSVLILLVFLFVNSVAAREILFGPTTGASGGDNLGDHTMTKNLDMDQDSATRGTYELNATATDVAAGVSTATMYHRAADAGAVFVCDDANSTFNDNGCRTLGAGAPDCPTGECIRNDSMDLVNFGFGGVGGSKFGYRQNNTINFACYNIGVDCDNAAPANSNQQAFLWNVEMDFNSPGTDQREFETYLQHWRVGAGTNTFRSLFISTNYEDFTAKRYGGLPSKFSYSVGDWLSANGDNNKVDSIKLGNNLRIIPLMMVSPSNSENTSTIFRLETSTGWTTDDIHALGGSSASPVNVGVTKGLSVDFTLDSTSGESHFGNTIRIHAGSNPFGACDGAGVEALGTKCILNTECNNGDKYNVSTDPGICVKTGGVCIFDNTCSGGTYGGGTCGGTVLGMIDSLCTSIDSGVSTSDCDSDAGTTASQCVDIQRWYLPRYDSIIGTQATGKLQAYNVTNSGHNLTMSLGYCSSTIGTGTAQDEGRACMKDSQCADGLANACVKNTTGSSRWQNYTGFENNFTIDNSTFDRAHLRNPTIGGTIGNQEIGDLRLMDMGFTWGDNVSISQVHALTFLSPDITGLYSAHSIGTSGGVGADTIIDIENQWTNAAVRAALSHPAHHNLFTDWIPTAIRVRAHSAINHEAAEFPLLWFDSFEYNTGLWKRQDWRMWQDGTNSLRVATAKPTSATSGEAVMTSPTDSGAHYMMICTSDGSALDTGTECCAAASHSNLSCVDASAMAANGAVWVDTGDCSSTHSTSVRYWAMCQ